MKSVKRSAFLGFFPDGKVLVIPSLYTLLLRQVGCRRRTMMGMALARRLLYSV
jgi:hypothetical protein